MTIFITSFHPLISRNILRPLLALLLRDGRDIRIVLVAPDSKVDFFEQEFAKNRVIIRGVSRLLTKRDIFLRYLALTEVDTKALEVIRKKEFDRFSSRFIRMLGRKKFWQKAIRSLDRVLVPRGRFAALLDEYRPALVFSTDVQNENDVRLMREAKDRGISVVGAVRSWDNFTTKGLLRVFPDILVVPNEIVKREAVNYNYFQEEKVVTVGIPHYDKYLNAKSRIDNGGNGILTREEFCLKYGFDNAKRIILFSPIGNRYIRDNLLDKTALETLSAMDANILVRIPPTDYVNLDGFVGKVAKVAFDESGGGAGGDRKLNEIAEEDDDRLIAELMHCDVIVTGQSTIAIDAAIFNKPIVVINFDQEKRSYWESIKRYYDSEYYRPVVESGGVRLANDVGELSALVEQYISNPNMDGGGRKRMAQEEAYKLDGQSTERLASVLLSNLNHKL